MEDLLTTTEAAQMLKVTKAALVRFRQARQGPPFVKIGRLVRYSADDLQGWLTSRRVNPQQATSN